MNINRIQDIRPEFPDTPVTVKRCGNVVEVRYIASNTPAIAIEKLTADLYADKRTGEVKEFQHHDSRAADKASVAQSLRKLRDLINANLENPETALWVTLTYQENMTDPAQLYEDYRRFWQRFKYYLSKRGRPPAEYIIAAEPQARGAWHLHWQSSLYPQFRHCPDMGPWVHQDPKFTGYRKSRIISDCLPREHGVDRGGERRGISGQKVSRKQGQEQGHHKRRKTESISAWLQSIPFLQGH